MATVHIPEAEAARDLPALLARVRAGEEIVIEKEAAPSVVLRVATEPKGRLLSESIALAKKHAKELEYEPVMDAEFAADLEEIIRNRKPRDTSAWD
jgi:antitoxin (DNA-binding transcriptional repressor) of toxin-antitoxin stability system